MTEDEAIMVRIAWGLAADLHAYSSVPSKVDNDLREKFIKVYQPGKPCQYLRECVETGRCPRQIACDN